MPRRKIDRLFLVEKTLWEAVSADAFKGELPHLAKMTHPHDSRRGYVHVFSFLFVGGHQPVKAFLDSERAEEYCKELEDEAWTGINPFRYGSSLGEWTALDGGRLRDSMLDIGLEPPLGRFDVEKWRKWYDVASASVSEMQAFEVRQTLDRLHFFRVSELTA